jgi:HD-GYP domain-containing protein (c-di-GMP phosphodiesterase class II)
MGLADDQITALRRAGVVHDVGKIVTTTKNSTAPDIPTVFQGMRFR